MHQRALIHCQHGVALTCVMMKQGEDHAWYCPCITALVSVGQDAVATPTQRFLSHNIAVRCAKIVRPPHMCPVESSRVVPVHCTMRPQSRPKLPPDSSSCGPLEISNCSFKKPGDLFAGNCLGTFPEPCAVLCANGPLQIGSWCQEWCTEAIPVPITKVHMREARQNTVVSSGTMDICHDAHAYT